jgi:hypothetical protein
MSVKMTCYKLQVHSKNRDLKLVQLIDTNAKLRVGGSQYTPITVKYTKTDSITK